MPAPSRTAPGFVPPQLATLVQAPPEGTDWLHESKFDGYRLLAVKSGKAVRLLTRTGLDWTARFPAITGAMQKLSAGEVVLDGEAVVLLPDGRTSFQALQQALKSDPPADTVFFAFDLLSQGKEDLRRLPLEARKLRLAKLLGRRRSAAAVRYSEHVVGQAAGALEQACRQGLEGIISKRRDQPYSSGRSRAWLKSKCQNRQEFVVVGFTEPRGTRKGVGSLLLGVRENGRGLRYAGKVGTGMSHALLTSLRTELGAIERTSPPAGILPSGSPAGVHWVDPRLVAEVSFAEWTDEGLLRHPAFEGIREDKSPREVRREVPMAVAGVTLSNPDRVLYPEQGITKQDLAAYYEAIADWMLPHVAGRPLSLVRCPSGRQKACFYQKHWTGTLPEALDTVDIAERGGARRPYTVVHDAAGLVSLVQHGVLEIHIWGAREDAVEKPDRVVFDLDPAPGVTWTKVREAAMTLRELLGSLDLTTWIKTTGGKGLHVVLPIVRQGSWVEVSGFARAVAERMSRDDPERYLSRASKSARKGKIFVDWLRNTRGATSIAPWSTRARDGAPISAPIGWEDLPGLKGGDQYSVANAHQLAERQGRDVWSGVLTHKQRLSATMLRRLSG